MKSDFGLLRDYEFDISLPTKPNPNSQIKFEVLSSTWDGPVSAPGPIMTGIEEGDNPKIHVRVLLSLNDKPFVFDWDNALGSEVQNVRGLFKKMAATLYPSLNPQTLSLFDQANIRSVDDKTIITDVRNNGIRPPQSMSCTIRISNELNSAVGNCSNISIQYFNTPSYQLIFKTEQGRKKIYDSGNLEPRYRAVIAAGWNDEAPVGAYRTLRVTLDSLRINNNHMYPGGLAGNNHIGYIPSTWYLFISLNGRWIPVHLIQNGLSSVVDGQTLDIGTSYDIIVPDNGRANCKIDRD